ncbi:MAG TPA: alcohol dehydrogenase catalytic domain-containing protein [Chloroflexota bacterium]|nr:alcohol dehydrogenase catalytic domain-containing protein [Chloroflexota bacterium]
MKAVQLVEEQKLVIGEVPTPQPRPGEVLVRVRAVGVCETDVHMYFRARSMGLASLPVILGHEFSGEVAGLGAGVTDFGVGDRVVVEPVVACADCPRCRAGRPNLCVNFRHLGLTEDGCFAEYVVAPARNLHRLPDHVSFEVGAMVEPLACTLWGLRRGRLAAGEDILIIGDGLFGLAFAQFARALGAGRVAVLGHHQERLALAREFGADEAMDEREPGVAEMAASLEGGLGPSVVVDTVGSEKSLAQAVALGGTGARIVLFGFGASTATVEPLQLVFKEQDILPVLASPGVWPEVVKLLGEGKVKPQSFLSQVVPLDDLEQAFLLKASRRPDIFKIVVTV